VATLRSFSAHARRRGWITDDPTASLERRKEPEDRTKAIAESSLERLFRRADVAVREKCLWRLLYETAARAEEVLSSNVDDLDLENKRLRVRRKGGDTDWLHFQSGSARLLPRVIADRRAGPIFLAERRPAPARTPAAVDLCPVTGRGRLSYERAEYLFKQNSFKVDGKGWTLHQLRHSALTQYRGRCQPALAHGQERPPEPAVTTAIRPPRRRSRRSYDRSPRPHSPSAAMNRIQDTASSSCSRHRDG